jgi:hypothetical protein
MYRRKFDGSGSWYHMSGTSFKQITGSGKDYVWAIKTNGYAYKCKKPCTGSWRYFYNNIHSIDGTVDGVGVIWSVYTYIYTMPYY